MAAVAAAISCSRTVPSFEDAVLFRNTETDTIPYRIPTLSVLSDGRLLALADYRHCKLDIGFGRVDIHGRISEGSGWGEPFVLIEGTGVPHAVDCGFGDAAMVADRESGEVLVITVCGETVYGHATTNRQNPNRVALLRSLDNCRTWEPWKEITEDVYGLFDASAYGPVQSCFVTSGKIFQSRCVKVGSHYRIYAALCARPNGNRVIYSDDFGRTWKALGGCDALAAAAGDEAKCEELEDGSVVISSRITGGRIFNVFTYSDVEKGEGEWASQTFSGERNRGCTAVANACNGEILFVPARRKDGEKVTLAFQSVPLGPERRAVGIYFKEIDGIMDPARLAADWDGPFRVTDKPSAYSTMTMLDNGSIAFYYEESDDPWPRGYDMVFRQIGIEEITSGGYGPVKRSIWNR